MLTHRLTALVFIFTTAGPAFAAEAKYVDKRNRSEVSITEVHFCYRPSPSFFGLPGHTYVAFYKQAKSGDPISFRAFGATADEITQIFGGNGFLQPEYASNIHQDCLVAQVNTDVYSRAWTVASPLFTEPEYGYWNYNISGANCVNYAKKVAESVGLKGNNKLKPRDFILQLRADN